MLWTSIDDALPDCERTFDAWVITTAESFRQLDVPGLPSELATDEDKRTYLKMQDITHWRYEIGPLPLLSDIARAVPELQGAELYEQVVAFSCIQQRWLTALLPTITTIETTLDVLYRRLRSLGFRDITACPKDGTAFEAIVGTRHAKEVTYQGTWPTGTWLMAAPDDWYPCQPWLYRPKTQGDTQ